MKKEKSLKEQLREKFDELPVKNQAADDWQKLKKVLNVAMPVTVLSFLFHTKVWFAKKMVWVYVLGVGVSGSTALVIYHLQQPKKAATQMANKDTVVTQKDTTYQEHLTTQQVNAKDTTVGIDETLRSLIAIDSVAQKHKIVLPPTPQDTVVRKHKTAPLAPQKDTMPHKRKTPPPLPVKDMTPKKTKKATPT
jgi:hypothetical protein